MKAKSIFLLLCCALPLAGCFDDDKGGGQVSAADVDSVLNQSPYYRSELNVHFIGAVSIAQHKECRDKFPSSRTQYAEYNACWQELRDGYYREITAACLAIDDDLQAVKQCSIDRIKADEERMKDKS